MSIVDWIFVTGVALTIVALLGSSYFFVQVLRIRQQINKLLVKRVKNKKKRKAIMRKRRKLTKKQKKCFQFGVILIIITGVLGGSCTYLAHYQAMNLTTNDSDSVVKGYYLLRDFKDQLEIAKNKSDNEEKLQKNIRYLATAMASYGTKTASTVNSEKGQLVLNRYYNAIKQVGMNASTQTKNFYGNTQTVNSFLEDLEKVHTYEKEAFTYYKVDESAFSKDK